MHDYRIRNKYKVQMADRKRMLECARRRREEDSDEVSDEFDDRASDSEGSNVAEEYYMNDQMYWDSEELEFMQLDEFTAQRLYYKITCC